MPYSIVYRPSKAHPGTPWAKVERKTGKITSRHRTKSKAEASVRAYYASLVTNATNPVRVDPTRTGLLRQRFMVELRKCFRNFNTALKDLMVEQDAFALKERKPATIDKLLGNAEPRQYQFLTDADKVTAFNEWLRQQVEASILSPDPDTKPGEPWTSEFIQSAYKRGHLNAYLSSKQAKLLELTGVGGESQELFLRGSFAAPETTSKIRLLGTRSWQGLKGITDDMGAKLNRILAQGIADGRGVIDIAREMTKQVGFSQNRAMTFARTEIINAHADGQLDAFQKLGIDELGVMAEWSTAGDERVCPDCANYEGKTFTVQEARGLIPYHPNCRCTWIPSEAKPKEKETPKPKPIIPIVPTPKPVVPTPKPQVTVVIPTPKPVVPSVPVPVTKTLKEEMDELLKTLEIKYATTGQRNREVHALLAKRNPGGSAPQGNPVIKHRPSVSAVPKLNEYQQGEHLRAETFLKSVVHPERLEKQAWIAIAPEDAYRARYFTDKKTLSLDKWSPARTWIHEYGHHLQTTNKDIFRAEVSFLKRRAKVKNSSELQHILGREKEFGFPGDFEAKGGSQYTGRVYNARKTPSGQWKWDIGEVMSTGIERLYDSPAQFYRDDPDFFLWVVEQIQSPKRKPVAALAG